MDMSKENKMISVEEKDNHKETKSLLRVSFHQSLHETKRFNTCQFLIPVISILMAIIGLYVISDFTGKSNIGDKKFLVGLGLFISGKKCCCNDL